MILHEQILKIIKGFNLMNDFFMNIAFKNNTIAIEVILKVILKKNDLQVLSVHTQEQIKNLNGHSVVLDIYAIDSNNHQYDIEIQKENKGATVKRARFYSSLLDSQMLKNSQIMIHYLIHML